MTIQVGHLYRKRTVRNLKGQIIDMVDETDGGVIISKGNVVNQAKMDEIKRKEDDKKVAARAQAEGVSVPQHIVEERASSPSKFQELEKRINDQDSKLDVILELLKKK